MENKTTMNTTDAVLEPSSTTSQTKLLKEEETTMDKTTTTEVVDATVMAEVQDSTVGTQSIEVINDETQKTEVTDKFHTTYRGPWMDALLTPSESQISQIKEDNRVRLVQENYEYFKYSDGSIDTAVSKLLDEGKLISTAIVFTSIEDNTQGDITDFIIKGNSNTVKDMIQSEQGTGKITHRHYFDATYTTDLRAKERYDVVYTVESIIRIIQVIAHIIISKSEMLKALTNCLVVRESSILEVKQIAKKLVGYSILESEHTFVTDVTKAQSKEKRLQTNASLDYTQEKQALKVMKDYAVLNNQGDIQIIDTTKHGLVKSSESGLKKLFANQPINGRNPVDIWMKSSKRLEFTNTKFDPSTTKSTVEYNLFKGFKYEPKQVSDISLFKSFVKEVICSGDDLMYNIVWTWMAQMVQKPSQKMGTALVLLSAKGTGKSSFVHVLGKLLEGYFMQTAESKRLLGEFNNHLSNMLLFYANELTFTDNKKVVSKLKNIITETEFTYEAKFGATFSGDNYIRVIIDSNDDLAVVQTADERRFIYPVISEGKIGDTEYFNRLYASFEVEGFYESLMYDLMNFNYYTWEHYLKTPPKNEVTQEQMLESFMEVELFWLYCLAEGRIPYVNYEVTYDGRLNITNEALYQSFVKHTRANGGRVNLDSATFGKAFKKHVLKNSDLDIKGKITVNGVRKNSKIYETREKSVHNFLSIKKLNNLEYDGTDWEECVI